jgi:hypothetical protein
LYPLEKNIIFIVKPTVLITLDEIAAVNCDRLAESTQRYFEMSIITKKNESFIFNNIERKEYLNLRKYFDDKKIKVSSDEDVEGGDNLIIRPNKREAPKMNIDDIHLPSDEDEYNDSEDEDEDFTEEESEEDEKPKKKSGKK